MGPITLEVVIPRVRKDGACAQFRPSQPEESMVQLYKAGRVEHMFVLKGTANVAPGIVSYSKCSIVSVGSVGGMLTLNPTRRRGRALPAY